MICVVKGEAVRDQTRACSEMHTSSLDLILGHSGSPGDAQWADVGAGGGSTQGEQDPAPWRHGLGSAPHPLSRL